MSDQGATLSDEARKVGEPLETDISGGCARCGEPHEDLQFKPLTRPTDWTHWAPCPTNGEPILLKIIQKDEGPA